MDNLMFAFNESPPYKAKVIESLKVNALISILILLLVALVSTFWYGLVVSIFFLIVQFLKSYRWNKFFITVLKVEQDKIYIRYRKENKIREKSGERRHFNFKKKIALNQTRTDYLSIYYKNKIIVKQFPTKEWNESIFDQIVKKFNYEYS